MIGKISNWIFDRLTLTVDRNSLENIHSFRTNKSLQCILISCKKSDFSLDLWRNRGTAHANAWRSPNLHVGRACLYTIGALCTTYQHMYLSICINKLHLFHYKYMTISIRHHSFSTGIERCFKKPWLSGVKIGPMFTKFWAADAGGGRATHSGVSRDPHIRCFLFQDQISPY